MLLGFSREQLVIIAFIVLGVIMLTIVFYDFVLLKHSDKTRAVREFLIKMICEAEGYLGRGEGEQKLKYVHKAFIKQFPFIGRFMMYDHFVYLVDTLLDELREAIEKRIDDEVKDNE